MPKPILYYTLLSPPTRGVLLTARELGLDLELVHINLLKGEHLDSKFLKLNPQHTLPTLNDNGTVLWDSHAISAYLVDKYAKTDSLYPKDLATRARVNQILIFDAANIFERLRTIVKPIMYSDGIEIPQERIDFVIDAYTSLELLLSVNNDKYLVGKKLTIGDLSTIASVASIRSIVPIDEAKFPKLVQWINRMEQLPYYNEINKKGVEELMELFNRRVRENRDSKA